jgi:hypothetical protein
MKIITTKGLDITVPKGSAFAYDTDPALPKAHMVNLTIGKRGAGKSVAVTNLINKLKFDRVLAISPTFKSNSQLMKSLNIDPDDVFEDLDDPKIVDNVIAKVDAERDDLVRYNNEMREYRMLIKELKNGHSPVRDDTLLKFFYDNNFHPPQHKYNGRNPFIALLVDDAQGSKLFRDKKITGLVIKHRHLGSFEDDRPSIGISPFFLVQNFRSQAGGISRAIRNNATNVILFKSKDETELKQIASELSGEISTEQFMKAYDMAMKDEPHAFLFIDMHPKKEHPSGLRSKFNKFLIP